MFVLLGITQTFINPHTYFVFALPYKPHLHCYLHKLRHTFGSLLVQQGVPLKTMSDLMGHRNILQTEKYVHIGDKQQAQAVSFLPRI